MTVKKTFLSLALLLAAGIAFSAFAGPGNAFSDPADPFYYRAQQATQDTDAGITAMLEMKLENYPNLIIRVKDKVVTLSGAVFNEVKHQEVLEIVRTTGGIKDLVDNMKVRRP